MHTRLARTALAAALIAFAAPSARAEAPSPLALPAAGLTDPLHLAVTVTGGTSSPSLLDAAPPSLAAVASPRLPAVEHAGVRYRPRSSRARSAPDSYGVSQLHVGFFDPDGDLGERFLLGLRGGPMIDPNIQLGLGLDWIHKTEKTSSVTSTQEGPGGVPIEVRQDLARASTNHFPVMAFLQVSAKDDLAVVPFFGVGAGYQVMVLSAEDFESGEEFDGTFGGWGWQVWGGAALPLSGRTRLSAELFVNGADLSRDVREPFSGRERRESVNADGAGMRFGLSWGF